MMSLKATLCLERTIHAVVTYLRECFFSHPLYITYFVSDALFMLVGATALDIFNS